MQDYICKVQKGENLSTQEAQNVIRKILDDTSQQNIKDFLTAMQNKEVSVNELVGFVKGMKSNAVSIKPNVSGTLVDTCGTGGDGTSTINISTGAAIIAVATEELSIAKHGNRSVSSNSGSADVLKEFGYNMNLQPEQCKQMIEKTGFGFLFAPQFYPAMKKVAKIRKQIGTKTIFNLLGPLCNPANAKAQLIGVYDKSLCEKYCNVLKELGLERALVVHGSGSLDEISNLGKTFVSELRDGKIKSYTIKPEDFEFQRYNLENITCLSTQESAGDLRGIFSGKKIGAKRDILVMNAGAAIYLGGKVNSLEEGMRKAGEVLDSGNVLEKLEKIVNYSNGFK